MPSKNKETMSSLRHNMSKLDIVSTHMLGWIVKPVSKFFCNKVFVKCLDRSRECKMTIFHFVTNVLSSVGRITLIVHSCVLDVILNVTGLEIAAKNTW